MENVVSKRVVLSAINTQLNHLTEAAGFCDFLLEQNRKTNPYLSEEDYVAIKNVALELYDDLNVFGRLLEKISQSGSYEDKHKSSAEN